MVVQVLIISLNLAMISRNTDLIAGLIVLHRPNIAAEKIIWQKEPACCDSDHIIYCAFLILSNQIVEVSKEL